MRLGKSGLVGAAATGIVLSLTVASGGVAAPSADFAVTATACYVTPKSGVSSVNIRTEPYVDSSIRGYLYAGKNMPSNCSSVAGGYYTACGTTSNRWIFVNWDPDHFAHNGYVASGCVRLVSDTGAAPE